MKDSVREMWLKKHGWQFEYREEVALSAINITESVRRQIRMDDKVDQAHVARLGLAIKDGASLPAVLLADVDGKMELADGIHRYSAYESTGAKNLDAYVITNVDSPNMLELLRRTANAPAVKGFSTEEATQQAIALVQGQGWKPAEAAHALQVSESGILLRIRTRGVSERISRLSPTADYKFAMNTLDSLGRIQRDDLLVEAARIAHQYKLTEMNSRPLFSEAARTVTDSDAKRMLDEWQQKYPSRRTPVQSHEPVNRLNNLEAQFRRALGYFDREKPPGAEQLLRWMAGECLVRAASGAVSSGSTGNRRPRGKGNPRSNRRAGEAVHTG